MMPLFEMMQQAQNGEAMNAMAKQFGMDPSQVEQAMEALMPAFSTGLKRNAASPQDMGSFIEALSGGQHQDYFSDMSKAFSPAGVAEGNGILGHLFGSKEVSRAVAQQAAQATGIGQDILKQMLPVIASTMMGGLFKQSTGQMGASAQAASNPMGGMAGGNILGQIMEQMMSGGGMGRGGSSSQSNPMANNPFGQMLEGMFGGGSQQRGGASSDPLSDNPLGQIFKEMMSGNAGSGRQEAPEPRAEPQSGNPYDQIFGDMFESGRKVQESYQKDMDSIFDQYMKGMNRHR